VDVKPYSVNQSIWALLLEIWHEESSIFSHRSPVVHEERLRPGDWSESVLEFFFRALTLLEGIWPVKTCAAYFYGFLLELVEERKQGELANHNFA